MLEKRLQPSRAGFTLLEIVIALAIFAVTLGATAQGLAYAYGLTSLQTQRVTANNDCRAIVSALRQVVSTQPDTTACPSTANKFPCVMIDFVNSFPANAAAVAALSATARVPYVGLYSLRNETYSISLKTSTGAAAVNGTTPSASTNPVYVTVTANWTGPRGIAYAETLQTIITDQQ